MEFLWGRGFWDGDVAGMVVEVAAVTCALSRGNEEHLVLL